MINHSYHGTKDLRLILNKQESRFFNFYLVLNGHLWAIIAGTASLTQFRPEDHWESRNEVKSLSPAEHLVGFEVGTSQF